MDFNNNNNIPNQSNAPNSYLPPSRIPGSGLAGSAVLLGIISILSALMMTVYLPFIFGSLAVVLAILSKGRKPKLLKQARTGIICSAIGLSVNIAIIASSFAFIISNPDALKETARMYDSMYEQFYGTPSDEVFGESIENIIDNFINKIQ